WVREVAARCHVGIVMAVSMTSLLLSGGSAAFSNPEGAPAEQSQRPNILILATGGTIAAKATREANVEYVSGAVGIKSITEGIRGIGDIAALSERQVSNIGSQNMTEAIWLAVAQEIFDARRSLEFDGIVITHGTDTIEETAFILDLLFPRGQPIV